MRLRPSLLFACSLGFVCACERGSTPEPETQPTAKAADEQPDTPVPLEGEQDKHPEKDSAPLVTPAPVDDPGTPKTLAKHRLDAPERYESVVIRAALPIGPRYVDLVYEGNNKHFRGPIDDAGLYRSGELTAADWRTFTAGVGGLIVLRDSLFSQQDHPTLQAPRALMLPPTWVSVAVNEVLAGRKPALPRQAKLEDDAAWAGEDIQRYFGCFPVSERLFGDASRALAGAEPAEQLMTRNARRSMQMLAAAATAMHEAAAHGPEAVAATGAEWIAASDRSYFGVDLRRDKIIPIFVEHPNEHEARDEGKGLIPWGASLDPKAVELTRRAVYGRRLEDGDLALERYDLRVQADQDRALRLLEELVPTGSSGHTLWLWVNGGTDGHGKGEPATPHVAAFQARIQQAEIALERVVLFSKPSVRPWGEEGSSMLETELDRHLALGIPLSAQLRTKQLRALLPE